MCLPAVIHHLLRQQRIAPLHIDAMLFVVIRNRTVPEHAFFAFGQLIIESLGEISRDVKSLLNLPAAERGDHGPACASTDVLAGSMPDSAVPEDEISRTGLDGNSRGESVLRTIFPGEM